MPAHFSDDAVNAKKDTNPKDAVGTGKVPFSTIPSEVVAELGLVMLLGARKYGRHNYRAAGVRASVYHDAAIRHLTRWFEGEDVDAESGISHLVHAMACCCVLRDSEFFGNMTDDRPPKLPDGWLEELNKKAQEIVDRYPDPAEAYTEQGQRHKDHAHFVLDKKPPLEPMPVTEPWDGSTR